MTSKKTIVYILPHYDDEIFVIPKIRSDLKNKHSLKFFFLMNSSLRLRESVKFLGYLGVSKDHIFSIGEKLGTEDGSVYLHLEIIFQELCNYLKSIDPIDEFVCTAYEGGHQDHDAASILTRTLAKKFNSKILEFYLYNGYGTKGKFYRVAHPINLILAHKISYTLMDYFALTYVSLVYKTQLSSMLGLLPFLFLRSLFGPLVLNVLDNSQLEIIDHMESPLYERWGRIMRKDFILAKTNYLQKINS